MSRKKPPSSTPSESPPREAILDDALRAQFHAACIKVLNRFSERVEHPDYEPTPTDIIGIIRAMQALEESEVLIQAFKVKYAEAAKELKKLEDRLLGLFQGL